MVIRSNCYQTAAEQLHQLETYSLRKDDNTARESQGSNGYHPGHHHFEQLGDLQQMSVKVAGNPQCGRGTQFRRSPRQREMLRP